jgi:hypothetical protein
MTREYKKRLAIGLRVIETLNKYRDLRKLQFPEIKEEDMIANFPVKTTMNTFPKMRPENVKMDKYIVRLYDGFDNTWIDISEPVSREEACKIWRECTLNGTKKTCFDDIDYYKIFKVAEV